MIGAMALDPPEDQPNSTHRVLARATFLAPRSDFAAAATFARFFAGAFFFGTSFVPFAAARRSSSSARN